MIFSEQAKIHIDLSHANLYIRLIVKVHTYQRPAGANQCAADAVFSAVVFIKGQHGSQDTGNAVLSCASTDYTVWTRSDTVSTTTAEPLEGQFINRPGRPQELRRFAAGETQDAH
jgi:hypothetical protein